MIERRKFLLGIGSSLILANKACARGKRMLHMSKEDHIILAKTIFGEARGEPKIGKYAVANSVYNRILSDDPLFSHDTTIKNTCLRKEQYSCWLIHSEMNHIDIHSEQFKELMNISIHSLKEYNNGIDYSNKATHYYKKHTKKPYWLCDMKRVALIENHIFFKLKA